MYNQKGSVCKGDNLKTGGQDRSFVAATFRKGLCLTFETKKFYGISLIMTSYM